jgi:hypothetical protein
MKLKHNKLRNTGLLFELLVRQITTDTLNNKESRAVDILKKNFNNTLIAKEYRIYKALLSSKNLSESKANVVIDTALQAHKKINKKTLSKQKYDLISQIKEHYNLDDFFKTKVDNYKSIASVYMLFEIQQSDKVDPESEIKYKFSIMEDICNGSKNKEIDPLLTEFASYDKGTKALVYKLVIQKFNEKYSNLNESQKSLLKRYITDISTPESFKEYVNEEYDRIKTKLTKLTKSIEDTVRKVKLEEVVNIIKPIPAGRQVSDLELENLLYFYQLEKELENIKR